MQSDCDPVESATKGAVKAGIEWSEEKIMQVYQAFKTKKLAFIEDRETIDRIQKQRRKGEWEHFKTYTPYNEVVYILFQTGLTLRELEDDVKKTDAIIRKIYKRYEAIKEQQKHTKNQIDNLFNVLMQKAFKGEFI